ncbi:MAG: hypothetical protein FWC39_05800 [Bacteroidetes bacterium]|nr:hypothetical protein [Bacteroidota bacterium]
MVQTKIDAELADFKKSWQYTVSKCIAVFSCVVAIAVVIDYFYDNRTQQIETQKIMEQLDAVQPLDFDAQLRIVGTTFHIDAHWTALLRQSEQIHVRTTRWFGQPKYLTIDNIRDVHIKHASIYNDGIILWAILLFLGLRVFFPFRSKLSQLLSIRYYNLFILPFINIYLLLGSGRLQHAIGVIF